MPNYKKRKRNTLLPHQGRVKKNRIQKPNNEGIEMSPNKKGKSAPDTHGKIRVVSGKKLENRRRFKATVGFLAVTAAVIIVLQAILPGGVFETLTASLSAMGSGNYPVEISGTDTLNSVDCGGHYYVLTDTYVNAFSKGGKQLLNYSHGFENPIMKASKTRSIVAEQGGKKAFIFSNTDLKINVEVENEIITAAISDSGVFALVTHSAQYTSEVLVYNKRGQVIYEWYSAEEVINNVAINPKGNKIAVATFNTNVGSYNSKLRVLNFKSADSEYSADFNNTIIYDINASHRAGFAVVTVNNVKFIKWSNYKVTDYNNSYNASMFHSGSGGYVGVFNRESDKTDNHIVIFSKAGEVKAQFNFKGIITDIKLYNGQIYCLSDTKLYIISSEGEILRRSDCDFGAVGIVVIGSNTVAVVTDEQVEKIKFSKE